MIGIIVEEATGNIRAWYDISEQDLALQELPPGHIMVVAQRSPNMKTETRVTGLRRRAGTALYDGTIQGNKEMPKNIETISDDQLFGILEQFEQMLRDGKDTEEAGELVAERYGITKEDVHQIVREAKAIEAEHDPQPGD